MPRPPNNSFDGMFVYSTMDGYVHKLCSTGLQPNLVSLIGVPLTFLIYNNMIKKNKWIVLVLLIIRQYLDCLDGELARKCKKTSNLGAKLDAYVDLIFTIGILYGFIGTVFPLYHTLKTLFIISIFMFIFFKYNMNFETHEMANNLGIWHEQNITVSLFIFWLIWIYSSNI